MKFAVDRMKAVEELQLLGVYLTNEQVDRKKVAVKAYQELQRAKKVKRKRTCDQSRIQKKNLMFLEDQDDTEYYGAAEPPVRLIGSQCSNGTEATLILLIMVPSGKIVLVKGKAASVGASHLYKYYLAGYHYNPQLALLTGSFSPEWWLNVSWNTQILFLYRWIYTSSGMLYGITWEEMGLGLDMEKFANIGYRRILARYFP